MWFDVNHLLAGALPSPDRKPEFRTITTNILVFLKVAGQNGPKQSPLNLHPHVLMVYGRLRRKKLIKTNKKNLKSEVLDISHKCLVMFNINAQ